MRLSRKVPTDDCFADLLSGDSPYCCAVVSLGQGEKQVNHKSSSFSMLYFNSQKLNNCSQ